MNRRELPYDAAQRRRIIRFAVVFGVLLLLLAFGSSLIRLQADLWWYRDDARAPVVFWTLQQTRFVLFLLGFLIATPLIFINLRLAVNAAMVFGRRPESALEAFITARILRSQPIINKLTYFLAPLLGILFGLSLAGAWNHWLLFSNAVPFGRVDPIFGRDYAFFVFSLPFFKALAGWFLGLVLLNAFITGGVFFALVSLASLARIPLMVPAIRAHISILAGFVFLAAGFYLWFSRFDAGTSLGNLFTGAGYADMRALGAKTITSYILFISAAAAFINSRLWRPYAAAITGAVVSFVFYLFGAIVWPGIVQTYQVTPNEIALQTPFIQKAIDATRWAYKLDRIEVRDFPVEEQPTPEAIAASKTTLQNMRLWDPKILQENLEVSQSLRGYYGFFDIDVDRYVIGGSARMLMLGARDIVIENVDPSRRNWQNLRLQYTHGNGVVAVPVNEVTAGGMPRFFVKDAPPKSSVPELEISQPRLYYSDTRGPDGAPTDRYVLVRSRQPEFDYSVGGREETHRWSHDGGIKISSAWPRFVYSFIFGDKDIYFSNDITSETRLLYRRNVIERARNILPFLKWDKDPYIAIIKGRLVWILDAYTTSDAIPYSAMAGIGAERLNYIRNSVKFTVDSYTGEWNAYIVEPGDPIIRAYAKIYPGLMKPLDEAPAEIRLHFRYPEDIFTLQSMQLSLYHVTEPRTFFRREDAWEIPEQTGAAGGAIRMPPYYVQMRLPDEKKDGFLLILPFSPVGRPNMLGWLAAFCDEPDYGRLVLYRFPPNRNIDGPAQQEAQIQTQPELSKELTLLGTGGSVITPGNLLVVPIGKSVMYVKTLFLKSDRPGIRPLPELKLVVLAYSDRIVYAETYDRALKLLTGQSRTATADGTFVGQPAQQEGVVPAEFAKQALELLTKSKEALRTGDWARYGELQDELEQLLQRAAR